MKKIITFLSKAIFFYSFFVLFYGGLFLKLDFFKLIVSSSFLFVSMPLRILSFKGSSVAKKSFLKVIIL